MGSEKYPQITPSDWKDLGSLSQSSFAPEVIFIFGGSQMLELEDTIC